MPTCAETTGRKITLHLRESDARKLQELSDYAVGELHLAVRFLNDAELLRIALHGVMLTPDIASVYRQIQAEDGRRKPAQPTIQIVNGEILKHALDANTPVKFALDDTTIAFVPFSQPYESAGLDCKSNATGNAVGGVLRADTVEFFRHPRFPDQRLKEIWARLTANPETAALKSRRVLIVQDLSLF